MSIPTIDTVVAPRANGFRNSGSASTFVICGLAKATPFGRAVNYANVWLSSFDGATHSVTCTAVTSYPDGDVPQVYVSKTVTVTPASFRYANWGPSDFGGTTTIPGSEFGGMSITCNLVPGTAITGVNDNYDIDIGT